MTKWRTMRTTTNWMAKKPRSHFSSHLFALLLLLLLLLRLLVSVWRCGVGPIVSSVAGGGGGGVVAVF